MNSKSEAKAEAAEAKARAKLVAASKKLWKDNLRDKKGRPLRVHDPLIEDVVEMLLAGGDHPAKVSPIKVLGRARTFLKEWSERGGLDDDFDERCLKALNALLAPH
jgi:hypothetical protein